MEAEMRHVAMLEMKLHPWDLVLQTVKAIVDEEEEKKDVSQMTGEDQSSFHESWLEDFGIRRQLIPQICQL